MKLFLCSIFLTFLGRTPCQSKIHLENLVIFSFMSFSTKLYKCQFATRQKYIPFKELE